MLPYASSADLATYTGLGIVTGADRVLQRASDLMDKTVKARYSVDSDGIPTDPIIAEALRDAVCAQVEFWSEVGESSDIAGAPVTGQVKIGNLEQSWQARRVAPRAYDILQRAGLLRLPGGTVPGGFGPLGGF